MFPGQEKSNFCIASFTQTVDSIRSCGSWDFDTHPVCHRDVTFALLYSASDFLLQRRYINVLCQLLME